jgi:transposase
MRRATGPTMRFLPVKSVEQQDLRSVHRARERITNTRTALINHIRGLLGEYVPQGPWRLVAQAPVVIVDAELSDLARTQDRTYAAAPYTRATIKVGALKRMLEALQK